MNRSPLPACLLLVAVPLGLAGCSSQTTEKAAVDAPTAAKEAPPVAITVAPARSQSVRRTVSAVGTLYGFEEITITPKVEGRVEAIRCEVGDRVKPESLLLEIDPTDLQLAVDEAQRGLEQELAKLGVSEAPGESFNIETLPSVVRAQLVVENAQKRFERQRSLIAKNVATQEVFEQTEMELKVADANLRQNRLDAQSTIAAVRYRLATLDVARQRLAETKVTAPRFDAGPEFGDQPLDYVVAQRHVSVGEMVRAFPSTPVYELVLDRILKLRARIPEKHLSQVQVGQKVEVRVDAWKDEIFPATIARISPTIDPQNRTFELEAIVPNRELRLKPGGFAKAEIIVAESATAVTVPLQALVRYAGVNKVFRIEGDVAQEVLVDLGGRGPGWIEVTNGLSEADVVATSGQGQLSDGKRVVKKEGTDQP